MLTVLAIKFLCYPQNLDKRFDFPTLDQTEIVPFWQKKYDLNLKQQQDAFEILNLIMAQLQNEFSAIEKIPIKVI